MTCTNTQEHPRLYIVMQAKHQSPTEFVLDLILRQALMRVESNVFAVDHRESWSHRIAQAFHEKEITFLCDFQVFARNLSGVNPVPLPALCLLLGDATSVESP